jgi:hypothetical protein
VLLLPPLSGTVVGEVRLDYNSSLAEQQREAAGYLAERVGDDYGCSRLPKRVTVFGVAAGGESIAYPPSKLGPRPVEDTVGGRILVVVGRSGSTVAYDRRLDGRSVTFERGDEPGVSSVLGRAGAWRLVGR